MMTVGRSRRPSLLPMFVLLCVSAFVFACLLESEIIRVPFSFWIWFDPYPDHVFPDAYRQAAWPWWNALAHCEIYTVFMKLIPTHLCGVAVIGLLRKNPRLIVFAFACAMLSQAIGMTYEEVLFSPLNYNNFPGGNFWQ